MSCTLWLQRTALHSSARKGHLDVVKTLVSCGADAGNLSIDTVSAVNAPIWCQMKSVTVSHSLHERMARMLAFAPGKSWLLATTLIY